MKLALLYIVLAIVFSQPFGVVEASESVFLTVRKCNNCSVSEFERIKSAVGKVNEVVVGACFRKEMSSMPLIQTEGRTSEQVVQSLIGVQIDAEMYWTIKRVLGYTLPNVDKIYINRRYALAWNVCDMASLLAHEGSHKVGYQHDFNSTKRRPNSVPYSINKVFSTCCK